MYLGKSVVIYLGAKNKHLPGCVMKNKPILLKSFACFSIYLIFSLLIIFVAYIIDFFEGTFILGVICGVIIAVVTICENAKKTIIARVCGIFSAAIAQLILLISGIPYNIIFYIFRNDEFVRETGRLTVNEVIGYNFGYIILWRWLLVSFLISIIVIFIFNKIKSRTNKK